MASAVASFAGKGRPKTFGAVSKTSIMHARRWRRVSGSRDIAALPTPPESTAEGFIDPLVDLLACPYSCLMNVEPT
jgi:hypothetical protein